MTSYRFTKAQRLRTRAEFERVYERRVKAGDRFLLVFAAPNELGLTRIGLSVSRKQGHAVVRSRRKRLLREAFRLSQHDLPRGLDLILIPSRENPAELPDLQRSLVALVRKLARRLETEKTAPKVPR